METSKGKDFILSQDVVSRLTHRCTRCTALSRLKGRLIQLPDRPLDRPLASKWIQSLDPLLALPSSGVFLSISGGASVSSKKA